METSSTVWGLDIGASSIKAVKLERGAKDVTVLGYAIEPIETGADVDRDEAVVDALSRLAANEEIGKTPVIAALSGRQVLARSFNVPIINEAKVGRMIELEARQQIPGDFDDVRWGYHMSPGIDGASNDVALFAARKDIVDDLVAKCRRAGLSLSGISVSSLAVYNFTQFDQDFEDSESVIVLDVGAENTDLVVYQGDTLWMRSLGVAGNDITRTFMKKFRVSFEEAEALKCQVGDSRQSERILKVIESILGELVSDVQRSLGFYKSSNTEARFENVVASGNTFLMPGLAQYMADRLGYAIITLIELERIQVKGGLDRDHFLNDLQTLGVAMGLGLQGLGVAKANVNLLPTEQQLQTILRQKRWAAIAILAILPIIFLVNHFIYQARLDDNVTKYDEMAQRESHLKNLTKKADETSQKISPAADDAARYAGYFEHRGLLHAAEAGIIEAITKLAADTSLLKPSAAGDPTKGGTPMPQSLYLEEITIPKLSPTQHDPFSQHHVARKIIVKVRVPSFTDKTRAINRLNDVLGQVRQTPAVYRALHPAGPAAPDASELPPMFKVKPTTDSPIAQPDEWVYTDPNYQNPETRKVEGKTYTNEIGGAMLTYECTLGGE